MTGKKKLNEITAEDGIAQVLQPDPASFGPHDSLGAGAADARSKTRFLSDPHRSREQTLPLCGARSTGEDDADGAVN